jgi:putative tryptophan/tyrosine transport system substrate-binding protein
MARLTRLRGLPILPIRARRAAGDEEVFVMQLRRVVLASLASIALLGGACSAPASSVSPAPTSASAAAAPAAAASAAPAAASPKPAVAASPSVPVVAASPAVAAASPVASPSAVAAAVIPGTGVQRAQPGKTYRLGISQLIPHPVLDVYRNAALDELKAEGFVQGQNLTVDFQNAQGDVSTAKTIADKFIADQDNVIFCITSPSCLAAAKDTSSVPIVFGYVTDAVAAGLVTDRQRPGGNVTGADVAARADLQLQLLKLVLPNARNVGTVWNPGEPNSKVLVDQMKQVAAQMNMTVVDVNASTSGEVPTAAKTLVGRVDAILITGDNTAQAALPAVIQIGQDNKLPVFTADAQSVVQGAIGTWSFLEEDVGKQAAVMVGRVLAGENPGSIPVESPTSYTIVLNKTAADKMGVTIPPAVLAQAGRVIP